MFFYLSKSLWFLVQPSSLIAELLGLGLLLLWWSQARWGKRLIAAGTALYLLAGFSPLGNWLLIPLEDRVPRADLTHARIAGIIVLGGALDTIIGVSRGAPSLNEAAERMTEALALARRFPEAPVIFSGGRGEILYSETTESTLARAFFAELGLDPKRLRFENKSRNTAENAAFTAGLLHPKAGSPYILVTSAFHMPRALPLFEAQGFTILPWPVDYRTRGQADVWRLFPKASEGLRRVDLAAKEWTGLAVSYLRGLTPSLLPPARPAPGHQQRAFQPAR
jgi:uncharacterized SAM-binding protein YcdF (DUF218 family)